MSTTALFHHVAKLHLFAHIRRLSIPGARRLSSTVDIGEQKKEEETEFTLTYNPSAYYQRRTTRSSTSEAEGMSCKHSAFRQHRNWNSISSSRRLSSAKNMLLNGDESMPKHKNINKERTANADLRAFQKCRPEYSTMTHDSSQHSRTLDHSEALVILNRVTMLQHKTTASDVTGFLSELSHIRLEQAALVRRDPRFSMLLRHSVEMLPNFTLAQLLNALKAFVHLDVPKNHSLLGLYEVEFCTRAHEMDLHTLFLVADTWRVLGRYVPQYLEKLYENVSQNLNPPELVQLLYVIGEGRKSPHALVQPIESLLLRYLHELKPEELGAVCLALFKSQMLVSSRVIQRLVDQTLVVVEDLSDLAIANVMKLIRFHHLDHLPWLEAMGREVPRRAPKMRAQGLMHVVLGCSALHYRDERVLLSVAEQLPNVVDLCRSKDAAKMLWAFGTLGVHPNQCPELYPCLTEVLRERQAEFERYPEHLLTGLLGLAFVGMFPEDLLRLALSEEFIKKACSSQELELKKDLFTLDETVALESAEFAIPRLSQAIREEVTKQVWDFAQTDACQKAEVLEAESVLRRLLGGSEFVHKHMILPYLRSIDLEVHLDQNDRPLPVFSEHLESKNCDQGVAITDDLLAQLTKTKRPSNKTLHTPTSHKVESLRERESIFKVGIDLTDVLLEALTKTGKRSPHPKPSIQRLAVQVTNRNQYCYRTDRLLGLHALKRRHLARVGVRVVELPHWEWGPLLRRSLAERLAYMHCKIFSSAGADK